MLLSKDVFSTLEVASAEHHFKVGSWLNDFFNNLIVFQIVYFIELTLISLDGASSIPKQVYDLISQWYILTPMWRVANCSSFPIDDVSYPDLGFDLPVHPRKVWWAGRYILPLITNFCSQTFHATSMLCFHWKWITTPFQQKNCSTLIRATQWRNYITFD